jgi:hypothetical protein
MKWWGELHTDLWMEYPADEASAASCAAGQPPAGKQNVTGSPEANPGAQRGWEV